MQPLPAIENGDGRCQMIQRFSVALQNPLQFLADGFGLGGIDGDTGRPARRFDVDDIEEAAITRNHRGNTVVIGRFRGRGRPYLLPGNRVQKFSVLLNGLFRIPRIHCLCIGMVHPD